MLSDFKALLGKGKYFLIGILSTSLILGLHTVAGAQDAAKSAGAPGNAMSPITILFLLIGIIVSILYIKAMLTVLNEAADTYSEEEEEAEGVYYTSPVWGAALAGILSALVIWSYGMSSMLLYLGPILAMVSPIAILYCMMQDIKEFKAAHQSTPPTSAQTEELTSMRS